MQRKYPCCAFILDLAPDSPTIKFMSSVLQHLDRLKESGFSEDQAKAIVSINQDTKEAMETVLSTKKDLELFKKDTKKDLELFKKETKKDLELLKKDLTIKIYSVTTIQIGVILAVLRFWLQ